MSKISKITELDEISLCSSGHLRHNCNKISKWWGKTYYHYNPNDGALYFKNFSLIERILHFFGYQKMYHQRDLGKWLLKFNLSVASDNAQNQPNETNSFSYRVLKKQFKSLVTLRKLLRVGCALNSQQATIKHFQKSALNINCQHNEKGTTPLLEACYLGLYDLAKFLIENGADLNARLNEKDVFSGKTSLYMAITYQHDRLAELLIENGADVNACENETIIHIALLQLYLRDHPDYDLRKKNVRRILDKNPDLNTPNSRGMRPLDIAINIRSSDVVKWLLEKGADPNAFTFLQDAPLLSAISDGDLETVRLLLQNGADPKINERQQQPQSKDEEDIVVPAPIQNAIRYPWSTHYENRLEMIQLLADYGVDINAGQNSTALHHAALLGDLEAVKLLLKLGADPSLEDCEKKKASDQARGNKRDEIVKVLTDFEASRQQTTK